MIIAIIAAAVGAALAALIARKDHDNDE